MTTSNAAHAPIVLCELGDAGSELVESFSPFCTKVHRALQLHGLPYTSRRAAMPSAYKDLNPAARVPVLLIGDEPVVESACILARLERLSEVSLLPADRSVAAEALVYEGWADSVLNGFVVAARWADERNWPRVSEAFFGAMPTPLRWVVPSMLRKKVVKALVARDVWLQGATHCWSSLQRHLDALEEIVPARGFLYGARPSVADVAIFAQLQSLRLPLTPWQAALIEDREKVAAWLERVRSAETLRADSRAAA